MGNLLSCLAVTGGLPCLLGSAGLSATGRLLALAEAAAAEVLASPFRLATSLDVGLRLTTARDVAAVGAMAVADVLREFATAVVKTGVACCLG